MTNPNELFTKWQNKHEEFTSLKNEFETKNAKKKGFPYGVNASGSFSGIFDPDSEDIYKSAFKRTFILLFILYFIISVASEEVDFFSISGLVTIAIIGALLGYLYGYNMVGFYDRLSKLKNETETLSMELYDEAIALLNNPESINEKAKDVLGKYISKHEATQQTQSMLLDTRMGALSNRINESADRAASMIKSSLKSNSSGSDANSIIKDSLKSKNTFYE